MDSRTRRTLASFQGKKILVVGDVMLDEYVWGDVNRVSPEAPVPVVQIRLRTYVCGGAANVAANIVSLGGKAMLGGVVGDDVPADQLRSLLQELTVEAGGLVIDPQRPTTAKMRVIAHSQQVVRVDSEQSSAIAPRLGKQIVHWAEERLPEADACVISDYEKGAVSEAVAKGVIRAAQESRKPVVVDPKGLHHAKYRGATVVTPNVREAEALLRRKISNEDGAGEAARSLAGLLGCAVIITRGADGMTVCSVQGEPHHIAAHARNAYDVTGAGDTVVSMLALCLASGASLEEAAQLANRVAGLVVEKVGTATVSAEELAGDAG